MAPFLQEKRGWGERYERWILWFELEDGKPFFHRLMVRASGVIDGLGESLLRFGVFVSGLEYSIQRTITTSESTLLIFVVYFHSVFLL